VKEGVLDIIIVRGVTASVAWSSLKGGHHGSHPERTEVLVLREILEDVIAKYTHEIGAATKKMPEAGSRKGSFFSSRSSRSSPLSSPRYDESRPSGRCTPHPVTT